MKRLLLCCWLLILSSSLCYSAPVALRHISFSNTDFGGADYIDNQCGVSGYICIKTTGGMEGFGNYAEFNNPATSNAGDSLQFPTKIPGDSGSIMMWIKPQAGPNGWSPRLWDASAENFQWAPFFSYYDVNSVYLHSRIADGVWRSISVMLPSNQWTHYAFTWGNKHYDRDLGTVLDTYCYINGNYFGSKKQVYCEPAEVLNIGGAYPTYHKYCGDMDDVYLFDNAITQSQLQSYLNVVANGQAATDPRPHVGSEVVRKSCTLSWVAPTGIPSPTYKIYVNADSANFNNVTPIVTSSTSVNINVVSKKTYYWKVTVVNGLAEYESVVWSFKTKFLDADFNGDVKVDSKDYALMAGNWGVAGSGLILGDIDNDGDVDIEDLLRFASNWLREGTSISKNIAVDPVSDAMVSDWGQDFIMPTPKEITRTLDHFQLSSATKIYVGVGSDQTLLNSVDFLLQDFADYYGIAPTVIFSEAPTGVSDAIIIGDSGRYDLPATVCTNAGISVPPHEDGYQLLSENNNIYIAGKSGQGAAYGVMTLLQLVAKDENGLHIKGAKISDHPAMDFRGVHLFTSSHAKDQLCRAVRDLLARYKINKLVLQCDRIKWDCTPELHNNIYGMSKSDAQMVISEAASDNIEIVPLISSLGHVQWMFYNSEHEDLAEDPDALYAYCPTNPETYTFIYRVFQEAIDFFNPKMFHIGHDEVQHAGEFPCASKVYQKPAIPLIVEDTVKLQNWFEQRNIDVTLWGDMFLHPDEASAPANYPENAGNVTDAETNRAKLSKDITFSDWHYAIEEPWEYTSISKLKNEGFGVIGSTWYSPENIANMAKAIVNNNAEGLLQTTWAGYSFYIDGNQRNWHQFWAYLLAAQYSWTGNNISTADFDFSTPQLFWEQWSQKRPLVQDLPGYLLNLEPLYNIDLSYMGLPQGKALFGQTNYYLGENYQGNTAVAFKTNSGAYEDAPESYTLNTQSLDVNELHVMLSSMNEAAEGKFVGTLTLKFDDDSEQVHELYYGKQVYSFIDERVSGYSNIVWRTKGGDDWVYCVHETVFENPTPDKDITSITVKSYDSSIGLILLGMTAVE